ncbi:HDOD domain-containing protein [Nitrogeniibacter mangrovi]|uniref:HDOD domain-containing protein n=1 Tax=Nitrogeniibacter mangrovi TaxID=2016596 RepID=A0A6C1B2D5_9RHOO|nr:HDOD domain-containing protein [Nitrogeniibacter mangrovi]QID17802.1 HDOD domain-containing protein [Nitrogeniibacter mangrovi]
MTTPLPGRSTGGSMSTPTLEIRNEDPFEEALEAFSRTIEHDLATRQLTFPTFLDLTVRIKRVCDDPNSTTDAVLNVIRPDPLLSARIIRLANSVALNPYGKEITSIGEAIQRVGLVNVRSLAFAVATEQLAAETRSADARLVASGLWMHTIDVAAWSWGIAKHVRAGNADTALFAGMLSTIGQFYLLARATKHPPLEDDMNRFAEFVALWHEPVARALVNALDVPELVSDVFDDRNPYGGTWPPKQLRDIYFIACLCADTPNPFIQFSPEMRSSLLQAATRDVDADLLAELRDSARETRDSLLAALRG